MADVFVKQYVLYLYQLREIVTEYYLKYGGKIKKYKT